MSEAPDLTEAEALAAEHALGVLSDAERTAADSRMATDAAFAADVEAWRERLAPLLADPQRTKVGHHLKYDVIVLRLAR